MNKTLRLWMLMALSVLCIGGLLTACEDESDVNNDDTSKNKNIVSKEYKDYLSAGGLRNDAKELAELAAHEQLLQLLFIKMGSGDWKEPLFSTYDYSEATMNRYLEVLGEAVEHADEYEAAIQRLSASQALGTNSPETRGFDNIPFYTAVKLTGYLKMSGKACRAAIVGVVANSGHADDSKWLETQYYRISPSLRRGTTDHIDFWQKFSKGELDNRACNIFGNLMSAGGGDGYDDYDFIERARILGITKSGMINSIAVPMITAGVNIVLNLTPTTTIAAETMEIGSNVSELVEKVKEGESVGGTLVKTVSSIAKTAYNHYGKAPVDGGNAFYGDIIENAQKELILGGAGDVEDKIATTLDNLLIGSDKLSNDEEIELLKDGGQAKVEFTDTDKKSPAQVVVATDKDGKTLGIGTPDSKGKTTVIVPASKEVAVTAIDGKGDKHTETATVKAGETSTIEAATNESENIETAPELEKPSISSETTKLEFEADGGKQTFNVTYKALFIAAAVLEDEAEDWCSVDFDNKGKITVTCKPNDSAERICTVIVGAWNDEDGSDMEGIEVQVVQSAGISGDLSFIDWKKFRIEKLEEVYVHLLNNPEDEYPIATDGLKQSFVFPNKSLTIKKISDSEYQVIGIASDATMYDSQYTPIPELSLKDESPYGIHYEVSFRVVAKEPATLVKVNNFGLKDIRIKGFYKTLRYAKNSDYTEYGSDMTEEFEYYFEKTGCDPFEFDYGDNPGKQCLQTMVTEGIYDPKSYETTKRQYWRNTPYVDEGGVWWDNWNIETISYHHTSTSSISSSFDVILRWD